MNLKELISRLEKAEQSFVPPIGFSNPHSYRGYYDCLAFEPAPNVSVSDMLSTARQCVGAVFAGWKGGEFVMSENTDVYIAYLGCTGEPLSDILVCYMTGNTDARTKKSDL